MKRQHVVRRVKSGLRLTAVAGAAAIVLAACGGGGESTASGSATGGQTSGGQAAGGSTSGGSSSTGTASLSLSGTVAVGGAISGANVLVIDANGKSVTATTDASGNYTVSLDGLNAPLLILASDSTGVHAPMASVVGSYPTSSTSSANTNTTVVGNVTTLTTAIVALLTPSGNPLDLTDSASLATYAQTGAISAAKAKLNGALASILSANGLSAASFDPVATPFVADQFGPDAVIDAVRLVPGPTGGSQLISSAAPTSGITLNQSADVAASLAAPPRTANYLSSLADELAQCLAGSTASCTQAIDANYKEYGYTSFTSAHSQLAAAGVTLGVPQTLEFFTGTGGVQQAMVAFPYVTAGGVSGSAITVVQQMGGGTWNIIGNQQAYNVGIVSYLSKVQFVDGADAPYSRYEGGLEISIPVGGVNPTNLASASVTGPGISGTAYLVPRSATGSTTLALTSAVPTSVPTGGVTSASNTNLYRWSWAALPDAFATYVPSTAHRGFYAASPIDLSTVPQFATYTVTFFDSTGTQIGQPMSVVNVTPPIGAAAGLGIAWQTLEPSVRSDFLNPAGALADAQSSVAVSWSNLVNGKNVAPLVSRVQIQSAPGTGATTGEVDGWWPGPAMFNTYGLYSASVDAGVSQSGVQQCNSACVFPTLQSGGGRVVQLSWSAGQVAYYNISRYVD